MKSPVRRLPRIIETVHCMKAIRDAQAGRREVYAYADAEIELERQRSIKRARIAYEQGRLDAKELA